MSLYLVQHGKALPEAEDPERSLSPEGRAEVERIAGVARGYGVRVSVIRHSGKTRARQTAELLAAALAPTGGVQVLRGLAPEDDPGIVARSLDPASDVMLVGHLPHLERLTALLVADRLTPPVLRFQNGGIVCLDLHPETRTWVVKWALQPRIG